MSSRTPQSLLLAAVLWIIIIGGMAATVRYLIMPRYQEQKQEELAQKTSSEGRYRHEVRLAADGFSGYCIFRSSQLSQRLARDAVKVTVTDDGADYMARIQALANGDIDMAVFPINSYIQCGAQLGNFPGAIVYIVDETVGADAIIAHKSSVSSINDLNSPNAQIVLTPDSPSEFLARVMIANFNLPDLPENDWMIKANGSAEVFKKFRGDTQNRPLAYAMWEPEVSRALRDQNAHVLLDSSKVKGYIVDVLVVRREFLVSSFDLTRQFVEAYARTLYAARSDMVAMVRRDAENLEVTLSREDAEQTVKGIEWKNILENYAHFGLQEGVVSLENIEDIIFKINDVLVKTGGLKVDTLGGRANNLYFDRILRAMKEADFHPGREINIVKGIDLGGTSDKIRETEVLPALNEAQWSRLNPVGELRVPPIAFGRGTSRITVKGRQDIKALAVSLRSWPRYYLTITGRVRRGGEESAALKLAKDRALAILNALVSEGIPSDRLRALAEIGSGNGAQDQSVAFVFGQMPY